MNPPFWPVPVSSACHQTAMQKAGVKHAGLLQVSNSGQPRVTSGYWPESVLSDYDVSERRNPL